MLKYWAINGVLCVACVVSTVGYATPVNVRSSATGQDDTLVGGVMTGTTPLSNTTYFPNNEKVKVIMQLDGSGSTDATLVQNCGYLTGTTPQPTLIVATKTLSAAPTALQLALYQQIWTRAMHAQSEHANLLDTRIDNVTCEIVDFEVVPPMDSAKVTVPVYTVPAP